MADAFYGEIRAFPFTFSPEGWELCDGHLLQVNTNQALYALLGNTFGGDGRTTFAVPNLQGLAIAHAGTVPGRPTYLYAKAEGSQTVQLTANNIPQHTHNLNAWVPTAGVTAMTPVAMTGQASMLSRPMNTNSQSFSGFDKPPISGGSATTVGLSISSFGGNNTGAAGSHDNLMPYLTLRYFICNNGLFPVPAD